MRGRDRLLPLAAVGSPAGLSDQKMRTVTLCEPQSPAARSRCIKTLREVLGASLMEGLVWKAWSRPGQIS